MNSNVSPHTWVSSQILDKFLAIPLDLAPPNSSSINTNSVRFFHVCLAQPFWEYLDERIYSHNLIRYTCLDWFCRVAQRIASLCISRIMELLEFWACPLEITCMPIKSLRLSRKSKRMGKILYVISLKRGSTQDHSVSLSILHIKQSLVWSVRFLQKMHTNLECMFLLACSGILMICSIYRSVEHYYFAEFFFCKIWHVEQDIQLLSTVCSFLIYFFIELLIWQVKFYIHMHILNGRVLVQRFCRFGLLCGGMWVRKYFWRVIGRWSQYLCHHSCKCLWELMGNILPR